MMHRYEVTIYEVGKKKPIITTYEGQISKAEVADFFGCHEPDVERYEIKEVGLCHKK